MSRLPDGVPRSTKRHILEAFETMLRQRRVEVTTESTGLKAFYVPMEEGMLRIDFQYLEGEVRANLTIMPTYWRMGEEEPIPDLRYISWNITWHEAKQLLILNPYYAGMSNARLWFEWWSGMPKDQAQVMLTPQAEYHIRYILPRLADFVASKATNHP